MHILQSLIINYIFALPRRGGDLDRILLKREAYWIHRLKSTFKPYGDKVFSLSFFMNEIE